MVMKSILQKILALLARATIWKYKPMVIGVTGSVGKTSTREAIACVLAHRSLGEGGVAKKYRVRQPEKNFNNEIGLPLTILGIPNYGRNVLGWLIAFLRIKARLIVRDRNYPEILVLEYGIDAPGDMDRLIAIAKPSIGVVTAIGEIPVHVEFFKNSEELAKEKQKLIEILKPNEYAILNADDAAVHEMADKTHGHVLTYGFGERADIRVVNYELRIVRDDEGRDAPDGVSFKAEYKGSVVPVRLHGALGRPQASAAAAAIAAGISLGMNLVDIAEALQKYAPQPGRMRLIQGIHGSLILDDTYNAAPESMKAALETLKNIPAKRKIAILGTMAELGSLSGQAHRMIGTQATQCADVVVGVGVPAQYLNSNFLYDDSKSAAKSAVPLIEKGDLILVKGSQSMRMERVVEALMAHPQDADKLLVRQEKSWRSN